MPRSIHPKPKLTPIDDQAILPGAQAAEMDFVAEGGDHLGADAVGERGLQMEVVAVAVPMALGVGDLPARIGKIARQCADGLAVFAARVKIFEMHGFSELGVGDVDMGDRDAAGGLRGQSADVGQDLVGGAAEDLG